MLDKYINRIIGKPKRRRAKDTDGDGVPDYKDCQPKNVMRQDSRKMLGKGGVEIMQKNMKDNWYYDGADKI